MEWKELNATFGALDNQTLLLREGFNLIHAPNESGKSTWCAFLRAMLYGLPTRDRKATAEKNRYAPWSGKAMEGQATLTADAQELTITRHTLRPGNPMAAFSARYTGTATPVPQLSSANCGEMLTGVPREVFERSAFITQSSMVIDQDAELERRIAALITSGEEGTSYTEAAERLKKQIYKRRYHKNGQLPALENEIAQLNAQLHLSLDLQQHLACAEQSLSLLEQQEEQLLHELTASSAQAETESHQQYALLQRQAEQADDLVRQRRLETENLPSRRELTALKSAAGSILVNQLTHRNACSQLQLRERERAAAETEVDAFPLFAGLTGEEARLQAKEDHRRYQRSRRSQKLLTVLSPLPLLASILLVIGAFLRSLPLWPAALPLLAIPALLLLARSRRRSADALPSAYGKDEENFTQQADAYYIIYEKFAACRKAEEEARLRAQHLSDSLRSSQEQIIVRCRELDPAVSDLTSAVAAIESALALWTRFEAARQEQEQLYARCEALAAIIGESPSNSEAQQLHTQLQAVRQSIQDARRQLSALQGQLQLTGTSESIKAQLAEKEQLHDAIQEEYDAISMALSALTAANTTLQNRFSPELGKKSAKYFAKLTKGKYNTVLLSRELEASAQTSDSPIPRPFWQLSQGAMEQLYLAVRLAICDLVLPEDKVVPLVLDDALSSFDDTRMAAALDTLMELSKKRQILFFTCQKREADYLRRVWPDQFSYTEL